MVFTADQIEETVDKLLFLKKKLTLERINELTEFEEFKTQNRVFYDLIVADIPFDMTIFKQMMKMKRKLEGGEEQYSVDVKFGEFMAEKYLKPVVGAKEQKQ